jgi:hypothetical protein
VTTTSADPIVLRDGSAIEGPLTVALGFLEAHWHPNVDDPSGSASFGEADLRLANRSGARISAPEIDAILGRRRAIERALRTVTPQCSLAGAAKSVPWRSLRQMFDAFADIRGVGLSKATKALHPKRPALIPMLDSVVQRYLQDDDPGAQSPFGERAVELVRSYKRDLDRNRAAMRVLRQELAERGYTLTEVRILDLMIWSVESTSRAGLSRSPDVVSAAS